MVDCGHAEDEAAEATPASDASTSAYFMKQTIGNACGTIALLHAIANLPSLQIGEHITYQVRLRKSVAAALVSDTLSSSL